MLSEELRQLFRAAAWAFIGFGVLGAIASGLSQLGIMGPRTISVNGNIFTALIGLGLSTAAAFVQGGIVLVLLSIDERIQKKAS